MEFLTTDQIKEFASDIREACDTLFRNPLVVTRKNAQQWLFFRICLERTLGAPIDDWPENRSSQMAQLKFEVENKLRAFYQRHGRAVNFVFSLIHRREAHRDKLINESDYPQTAGYYLLVRDYRAGKSTGQWTTAETRAYLEKVVTASILKEIEAYQALPGLDEPSLKKWLLDSGGAYRELIHTLHEIRRRGWILSNSFNPSTNRVLSVKIKDINRDNAVVRTKEYWHLKWWSNLEQRYVDAYRDTIFQTYILTNTESGWLIEDIIRPASHSILTTHRSV